MNKDYVKKTMLLKEENIKKALKILNVKTEKDAVNRALELVVEEDTIISAHKEIGGTHTIRQVYT